MSEQLFGGTRKCPRCDQSNWWKSPDGSTYCGTCVGHRSKPMSEIADRLEAIAYDNNTRYQAQIYFDAAARIRELEARVAELATPDQWWDKDGDPIVDIEDYAMDMTPFWGKRLPYRFEVKGVKVLPKQTYEVRPRNNAVPDEEGWYDETDLEVVEVTE